MRWGPNTHQLMLGCCPNNVPAGSVWISFYCQNELYVMSKKVLAFDVFEVWSSLWEKKNKFVHCSNFVFYASISATLIASVARPDSTTC